MLSAFILKAMLANFVKTYRYKVLTLALAYCMLSVALLNKHAWNSVSGVCLSYKLLHGMFVWTNVVSIL